LKGEVSSALWRAQNCLDGNFSERREATQ